MTDTPPTATDTSRFGPEVNRKMAGLVIEHNRGEHRSDRVTGCPGCLLSGALDQDGGEG